MFYYNFQYACKIEIVVAIVGGCEASFMLRESSCHFKDSSTELAIPQKPESAGDCCFVCGFSICTEDIHGENANDAY